MTLEILNKRSSALNSKPTAAQLEDGEIGINYNADSLALYVKDTKGAIRKIAGEGSAGQYWDLTGTTLSPDSNTYGVNIGAGKSVLNADGSAAFSSKVTSAATVAADGNTTLTTKGYVDSVVPTDVGVTKIIAGTDISISPNGGTGEVTINATGGGSAQIQWNIENNGSIEYIFEGPGFDPSAANPTLYVVRGQTYVFNKTVEGHPFQLQAAAGAGQAPYTLGVTGNQPIAGEDSITWVVPMDAPATLYYACTAHPNAMAGTINVLAPGGGGGGASIEVSDDAPETPSVGDLWWDSSEGAASNGGRLYLYYGTQWVQTSNIGSGGGGDGNDFWSRRVVEDQGILSPSDSTDNLEVGGDGLCVTGRRVGIGRHPSTEENDPQLQVGGDAEIGGNLVVDVGNFEGSLAAFSVGTNRDGEGAQDGGHLGIYYTTPTEDEPGGANVFTSTGPIRICTDGALEELESSITLGGGLDLTQNNWLVLNSEGNATFSGNITAAGSVSIGGTDAAHTIDEYEEGTWVPKIEGSSSQPSITYTTRIGEYVRVGKLVTVNCSIGGQYTGGGGGSFLISGLPFEVKTSAGTGGSVATNFIAIPENAACVTSEVRNNTASFYAGLVSIEGGFSWANLSISNLPSGGFNYRVQMSYYIN